ncbi:U3 small nucleolar RNA-associated protein 10 [[Candida] railenensis]|uniref:U3 small nucleolar RNA-associated protein 10 n=1 Tax=[Candida] railenensis TaxID=45579 RepID=A0A9P0QM63_9ASCO|nr:U3 small nucleolar RNA-associated protein 10 [[Candida] railenensis]
MSSLSAQLNNISQKTASIALDRKSRSKIHSRSLIFDPKTAAGQDFDFIYSYCLQGFEELCELDSRFQKFSATLFSETSMNTDRNVQTKDVVDSLNKNIEVFLTLVGPYWLLNPAARAVEWLVRRFHANIHNAEMILLSVLPYYKSPIFVRCMNVISKGNDFPAIFQWLSGYREQLRSPTSTSLVKAFVNHEFFKFYNAYLVENLKNRTAYKDQLVLYLSCTVQVIASFSKSLAKFQEDGWLSLIVEGVGQLLVSRQEHQFSLGVVHDCKLTAYSIISVLSSIVPLSQVLIESITKSIVSDPRSFEIGLKRQTLIVLGQIWSQSSAKKGFPACHNGIDKYSLKELSLEGYKVNKLIISFVLSDNNNKNDNKLELLELISIENDSIFREIVQWLLLQIATNTNLTDSDRKVLVSQFQKLMNQNLNLLKTCLNEYKSGYKVSDLEMALMATLGGSVDESDDMVIDMDEDEVEDIDEDAVEGQQDNNEVNSIASASVVPTGESFFCNSSPFKSHLTALLTQLSSQPQNIHRASISKFSQSGFKSIESSISFYLRVAFTPAVPYNVRLLSLRFIKLRLKELSALHAYDFYLLIPLILLGLFDNNKNIRAYFVEILKVVQSVSLEKNKKTTLFMEEVIYNEVAESKRAIISPADALKMLDLLNDDIIKDVILDSNQLHHILDEIIYKPKAGKKFGQLFKTFILTQWGLDLHVVFKDRSWKLSDDCKYFFDNDFAKYQQDRDSILENIRNAGLSIESVEHGLFDLVGKGISTAEFSTKSVNWLVNALSFDNAMQVLADAKCIQVFEDIKSLDLKLKIVCKYIDMLVNEDSLEIDPMDSLQSLTYDFDLVLAILKIVQISTQIPEQGVPKRRRRSSSSTKQAMARDDINNMASIHLKKLTIVLDLLETVLKQQEQNEEEGNNISAPALLQSLFKSLTDLDYLGNDGNLPVLYAQETLARCMSLSIVQMKRKGKSHSFDSNSVRADLIVNCIRSSQSPQVQNRLLLVIAELASLAPEIILHSVMPIFTFMGAHTIRQDDEFSNSVLQQTISKVIPAIAANGSSSLSNEIEFLLTSFAAAFQHIPRHRRVKLFTTLAKTLGYDKSLDIILFLMGQQYSKNGSVSVIEFSQTLLKQFSAREQLTCLTKYFKLWSLIPDQPLESGSEKFNELSSRSIFGVQILSLSKSGLVQLKSSLLKFIDELLVKQEFEDFSDLKLKVAFKLKDEGAAANTLLEPFRDSVSFLLTSLEQYNNEETGATKLLPYLYKLLSDMLDLLPISYFIDSIIEPLNESQSGSLVSIRIARNLCILAGTKIETELNSNNIDSDVEGAILDRLLPALIANINASTTVVDIELQQALLGTFSTVIEKMGSSSEKLGEPKYSRIVIDSLKFITSEKGLLNSTPEVIISSINAISSIVNVLGVKVIGFFPKIIPPVLAIWKKTEVDNEVADSDSFALLQTSILVLFSCFIKKMPAFMNSTLDSTLLTILNSNLVDTSIRSNVLQIIIQQMDEQHILKTLCKIWNEGFRSNGDVANLGLYINTMQLTIDSMEKKTATSQATTFVKWLISAFEFREEAENKLDNNTIRRLESSFHSCGISYVMKLNDKAFRPLFAQIVRWATTGEGSSLDSSSANTRLLAFFKFFNKLQEQLKSIVTSYYTYLIDPVAVLLQDFASLNLTDINLRRVVLNSLTSSFKYDQDDFWSTQSRFETIFEPLLSQLYNIEDSIGKYIVKAITSFIVNVSSDEYNEKLVHGMISRISNDNDQVNSQCKIWSIRTLKSIFQKMGDQWLTYLPTLIPYIAELLEDDDEEVELEVRKGLVRVIENVLGEPLDRYLD